MQGVTVQGERGVGCMGACVYTVSVVCVRVYSGKSRISGGGGGTPTRGS